MIWFVDASALVKRYVNETGSHWLRSELVLHQVAIAEITAVELIAAAASAAGLQIENPLNH